MFRNVEGFVDVFDVLGEDLVKLDVEVEFVEVFADLVALDALLLQDS